jgi:DNA polymerase
MADDTRDVGRDADALARVEGDVRTPSRLLSPRRLAEEAVSSTLIDLSPDETAIYTLDQQINERGFQLDMEAPRIALQLIATASTALNAELLSITNGSVSKATQRDKIKAWLRTQGLNLANTQGATLDRLLALPDDAGDIDPDDTVPWADPADADFLASLSGLPRRALEIVRTLGRSSTAKYRKMLDWAGDDGRVRGGLLYHGASTGRWSGAGVQPHNFPKGSIKGFDMEAAWDALKRGVNPYPDYSIMEVLSCALRGAIVAREGYELYVADFAGIEARGLLWVARDERGLDIFRRHADPYCDMAQDIYDRPITKADKAERSLGKIAVLGLGYQMGWSKFQATCEKFGIVIDDEMAERVVRIYREKFERVKKLWWNTEDAACEAVSRKGVVVKQDRISWIRRDRFLYCVLPSGRQLAYPDPELRKRQTPWGAEKWALTFMGVNSFNRKWQRQTTYGGSLVENIVQAISRDLMAAALQRIEASGTYIPVLSVHDEAIAEATCGQGDVKEFEALTAAVPTWAAGMPIEAEGWKWVEVQEVSLRIVPLTLKQANDLVTSLHRHHKPSQGHRFSIGCEDNAGVLHGAAICGRPVARGCDPYRTLEVTRLVTDGTKNACSILYAAAARIAREMGFTKIQTYILQNESGHSLKVSGWVWESDTPGGDWNQSKAYAREASNGPTDGTEISMGKTPDVF